MRHLRPRKRLGQAFLTHEPTADALAGALAAGHGDTVLEIGPGKGILTRRLLKTGARVVAVEIDERLAAGLEAEMSAQDRLTVVHADFMEFDLARYENLLVMGNLPYNLSSQMLFRLLDFLRCWTRAVLTTQREFAQRLLASPGTKAHGALTVFFDRLVERERLFNIEPACFKPKPDVVSTSFRLTRRDSPLYQVNDDARFRALVKACFSQRRKTLVNNLAAYLGTDKRTLARVVAGEGIGPDERAENLTGPQFALLAEALAGQQGPGYGGAGQG